MAFLAGAARLGAQVIPPHPSPRLTVVSPLNQNRSLFHNAASNTPHQHAAALRADSWTWLLELMAAGVQLTANGAAVRS